MIKQVFYLALVFSSIMLQANDLHGGGYAFALNANNHFSSEMLAEGIENSDSLGILPNQNSLHTKKVFSNPVERDRAALMAFYDATDGDNWIDNTNWGSTEPLGDWYGVSTNADGCVFCLDLDGGVEDCGWAIPPGTIVAGNGLSGTIPTELGDLLALQLLILAGNDLSGPLPNSISNLTDLFHLVLPQNNLSGSIPSGICQLNNLKTLFLSDNQFDGAIPAELGDLENLEVLLLETNDLSGQIPPSLGGLPLTDLVVTNNPNMIGGIPDQLQSLSNLRRLALSSCSFTGRLPQWIANISSLEELEIFNNQFDGVIPPGLGDLPRILVLQFGSNNLSGCFPTDLNNLCDNPLVDFSNNPQLPWQGDFSLFCDGEQEFDAVCDDGDPNTIRDMIASDCTCLGVLISCEANAGNDQTLDCNTTSVELIGSASSNIDDFSISWVFNGAEISTTENVTVTEAGIYTFRVFDPDNLCGDFDEVEVFLDDIDPVVNIEGNELITCLNPAIELQAITISLNPTFEWSGPVTGQDLSLSTDQAGIYTLLLTGENGCTTTMNVEVLANKQDPFVDAGGNQILLLGQNLTLDGSNSEQGTNFNYEWYDENLDLLGTGITLVVNEAGTYQLVVTNTTNGCTASDFVEVTDEVIDCSIFAIDIDPVQNIDCNIAAQTLSTVVQNGTQDLSYQWTDDNGNLLNTNDSWTVTTAGTYTVIVTDNLSACTASDEVQVILDVEEPDLTISGGQLDCNAQEINISASSTSDVLYSWTGPGGFTASVADPLVDQPGTYDVTITSVTNGCTAIDNFEVLEDRRDPIALIDILGALGMPLITCDDVSVVLSAFNSSAPNGSYDVEWLDQNNNPLSTEQEIEINNAGTLSLVITDQQNGCTATESITIDENRSTPQLSLMQEASIGCIDGPIQLEGSATSNSNDLSYVWSSANGNILNGINSTTLTIDQAGLYILEVTDNANGCIQSGQVLVEEYNMSIEGQTEGLGCNEEDRGSITLNVIGGASPFEYFINGQTNGANSSFEELNPGTYEIEVIDANDCVREASYEIANSADMTILPFEDIETRISDSVVVDLIINNANGDLTYLWEFLETGTFKPWLSTQQASFCDTCSQLAAIFFASTDVRVTVADSRGCMASFEFKILVDGSTTGGGETEIVDVITPNGDGKNDGIEFIPDNTSRGADNQLFIVNRWGNILVDLDLTGQAPFIWEGKGPNGGDVPEATYYYIFKRNLEEKEIFLGRILVLRGTN